jgi:hypothetical protein
MTSYRGYAIRRDGRIRRGAYLKADTPSQAHQAALDLCEEEIDHVEVWADAKLIEEVPCQSSDASGRGSKASASAS